MIRVITSYEFNNKELDHWLSNKKIYRGNHYSTDIFVTDTLEPSEEFIFDERLNIESNFIIEWDDNLYDYEHITVRQEAWKSFIAFRKEVAKLDYEIYSYWSFCQADNEIHTHMIVRYPREKKIVIRRQWNDYVYPNNVKPILTQYEFISTIYNLSKKSDNCIFARYDQLQSNYFVNKPLPPQAMLFMSLLYKGGLSDYLIATTTADYFKAERNDKYEWCIQIGHLNETRDLVLPISRDKQFGVNHENIIYLPGKHITAIVDFDKGINMDNYEWNRYQIQHGNVLLDAVEKCMHVLSPSQQQIFNIINKIVIEKDKIIQNFINKD